MKNRREKAKMTKRKETLKILKNGKGITLIALVVTIIVLLILAGVSIATLTGDNGILTRANDAKEQTEIGTEKEQVQLAYIDANMQTKGERITEGQLQSALDNLVGENQTKAIDDNDSFWVKFQESGRYYRIDDSGNITDPIEIKEDKTPGILTGSGTEEDPYVIMSIEDLVVFSNMTNGTGIKLNEDGTAEEITEANKYGNKYVILDTTLNFKSKLSYVNYARTDFGDINNNGTVEELMQELTSGTGFTPINTFGGYFNGNNNEIQNIYINIDTEAGLFAESNSWAGMKKIENIGITGNITSTQSSAAGICKYSETIENCWNKANVTAVKGSAAGICNVSSTIKNCYNTGKIVGSGSTGGIVAGGFVDSIENSYNKGEVTGGTVGGIASGHNNQSTTIKSCYNEGEISGGTVGGILGNNGEIIENCYNLGNVKHSNDSGVYTGGIVGKESKEINNCFNKGNISGTFVGGIAGSIYNRKNNKFI